MQLIPHSARDRRSAIIGFIFAALAIFFLIVEEPLVAGIQAFCATILFITAYVFPDTEGDRQATDYSKMIKLITESQSNFDQLKAFLEVESERVSEVQLTLEQLNKEKQELEPVVSATRGKMRDVHK